MFGGTGRDFIMLRLWNRCRRLRDSKFGSCTRQGSLARRFSRPGISSGRGVQLGVLVRDGGVGVVVVIAIVVVIVVAGIIILSCSKIPTQRKSDCYQCHKNH